MDRTAADLEANIDEAAEQTQAVIGAVSERLEGAIEDAPRQTASVVQSVSSTSPEPVTLTSCFSAGRHRLSSAVTDNMSSPLWLNPKVFSHQ